MEKVRIRALLMNTFDALSFIAPSHTVSVQHTALFSTPRLLSFAAPISSLVPKMNRVYYVAPSDGFMIFTGSLNFLDAQSSVNHMFGLSPPCFVLFHVVDVNVSLRILRTLLRKLSLFVTSVACRYFAILFN